MESLKKPIEVLSVVDENGVRSDCDDLSLNPEPLDKGGYIYITDTSSYNVETVRPSRSDDEDSGVYIKPPKKLPWAIIGSGCMILFTVLFNASMLYNNQSTFNEKVLEKLDRHSSEISNLKDNTYTKREDDLKHQNVQVQLERLEYFIHLVKGDVEALEGKERSSTPPMRITGN